MSSLLAARGKQFDPVQGKSVWKRKDLDIDSSWRFVLTDKMVEELESSIDSLPYGIDQLSRLCPEHYSIPSLTEIINDMRATLGWGRGLVLLGGLPIERYSYDQATLLFYGIAIHLGIGVSQSHRGDYIGDVIDRRSKEDRRPYHNGGEFIMHRDPVDETGLLSIRKAREGGYSRIISSATVHNVLLEQNPEVMEIFYRGFPYMRLTPDRGETDLYTSYRIPVFRFRDDGSFVSHYIPAASEFYFERDHTSEDHPERIAQEILKNVLWKKPDLYYEMLMQPGDMQFVNNRLVMHARTDYVDFEAPEKYRLLLRSWAQVPEWGALPADQMFYVNTDRAGGGIAAQ